MCRINDMFSVNEFLKRAARCFVTKLRQRREVDGLAIKQSGDKPCYEVFFRAPNADDFETLPPRLYLSGSLRTIGGTQDR